MPYFIVADDAFELGTWLMQPFLEGNLNDEEHNCNYRLSRARWVVKNAFTIQPSDFRCLLTTMAQMPHLFIILYGHVIGLITKDWQMRRITKGRSQLPVDNVHLWLTWMIQIGQLCYCSQETESLLETLLQYPCWGCSMDRKI